ncbi:WhiB family transcriptional regulator [Rhodococcus sp. NPDC054953]
MTSTWINDAACRGQDTDLWFPGPAGDSGAAGIRICQQCSVREQCLADAMAEERGLSREQRHGIRGGLTRKQRAELDRKTSLGEAA